LVPGEGYNLHARFIKGIILIRGLSALYLRGLLDNEGVTDSIINRRVDPGGCGPEGFGGAAAFHIRRLRR
jgi:hypothetical protein